MTPVGGKLRAIGLKGLDHTYPGMGVPPGKCISSELRVWYAVTKHNWFHFGAVQPLKFAARYGDLPVKVRGIHHFTTRN
jgi:hypothetical protein